MTDRFLRSSILVDGPAVDGFAITANSSNVFSQPTRSLYVGVGGDVTVMMTNKQNSNTILTFPSVPAGTFMPIRAQIVYANTTANGLVGLF